MRKILVVLLAAALLCPPVSLAENAVVDISGEGYDCMYYQCTLPDGRVVLTGWKGVPGNWQDSRARILCLNPDMTVNWEYLDPAEGRCGFTKAVVLKDGRLGAVFENAPDQDLEERKLKFFSPDGKPDGEEIDLTIPGTLVDGASASCLWLSSVSETLLVGWDGAEILRFGEGRCPFSGCGWMAETEDGLVFAGQSPREDAALLVKIDFQGAVVWRTVIPASELPGVEGSNLTDCMKTEDGGYLAQLVEYGSDISASLSLVRFGADGRLLWKNADAFERCPEMWLGGLAMYGGRIVAEMLESGSETGMNAVSTYLWMDGEGNWLAATESDPEKLAFPRLPRGKGADPAVSSVALVATRDGLWSLVSAEPQNVSPSEMLDGADYCLVRVPEP